MKSFRLLFLVLLYVGVIGFAIQAVVQRHESRSLFMKAQKLEKQRDQLMAEWSRLKLEQSTLLNQVRVEREARWALNMQRPKASQILTIQE